ncbi:MAG: ice-binding family protein [Syntrophales bacterium]
MMHTLYALITFKMRCKFFILLVVATLAAFLCSPAVGQTVTPVLGTAQDFAVLGHTTVTNTGPTVIFGSATTLANVGVYNNGNAGDASTGFLQTNSYFGPGSQLPYGPGLVNAPAAIHLGDSVANLARNDLITAYSALAGLGATSDLTGEILGNGVGGVVPTLGPGVYTFTSSAQLNGTLKLNAGGVNGVSWVFKIGSTLTTASASAVQLINPGGNHGADDGVFWLVGSDATLGTTTAFEGNILAVNSITLNTGATILNGRALAENAAVTLDSNVISDICPTAAEELSNGVTGPGSSSPNSGPGFSGVGINQQGVLVPVVPTQAPEPTTMLLLGLGLIGLAGVRRKFKQ